MQGRTMTHSSWRTVAAVARDAAAAACSVLACMEHSNGTMRSACRWFHSSSARSIRPHRLRCVMYCKVQSGEWVGRLGCFTAALSQRRHVHMEDAKSSAMRQAGRRRSRAGAAPPT